MLTQRRPADTGGGVKGDAAGADANRDLPAAAAGEAWSCWQRMMRSETFLSMKRSFRKK